MRYPLGQPIRLSTSVRDLSGALVAAGALTLTVQRPDGTQQAYPAPTNDGTGLYHQDVPATDLVQVGHYQYKWVATGQGAGVSNSVFDIFDPFAPEVLSLDDLKTQLGITTTTHDDELALYAATAVLSIEDLIGGPFLNRQVTEVVDVAEDGRSLVLGQRGVSSVVSVTAMQSGAALSVANFLVNPNAGVIRQKLGVPFYWTGPFQVTYIAGQGTDVPENVNVAARIIGQHLWITRRGPATLPSLGGEDVVITSAGYAIPRRAAQLLAGYVEEAVVG